jgi:hypothetical protein
MNIKIKAREDSMGCLTLTPVKQSYIDQIIEYLKEFNVDSDGSVFIQSDYDIESFYNDCNARQKELIQSGWGSTMLFDAWTFLTMIGYDASEGLELK